MATAASTEYMSNFLTSIGVTTPTIDSHAPSNSYAYEFIECIYQLITSGMDAILTDGTDILVDQDGNVLMDSI